MRNWWRTAATAAVGLLASTTVVLSGAPAVQASTGSGSAVGLLAYGNTNLYGTDPGHFDVVIINADQYGEIPKLRAANPNVRIFVYKNIAMAETYDVVNGVDKPFLPTGVGYAWTMANHPGWFLKDTNGKMVEWADYPSRWWLDMGNASYQNTWASNVIAEVHKYGLDGVMMDDVDMHTGGHLPAGVTLAKYPTDADYAVANESFIANVGPQLTAAGITGVANIAFRWSTGWETPYKRWLQMVDGVLMEWWTKPGLTSSYSRFGENDWDYQMQQAADVRAAGKLFIPLTYGAVTDTTAQTYSRASFLLAWDGGPSTDMWVPDVKGSDPWTPAVSAYVGKPTGERRLLSNGVWRRDFTSGTVLVNPSRSVTRTVSLSSPMLTTGGQTVSSVSLAPMTGAVLTAGATATSPTSSPSPSPSTSTSPAPAPSPTATTGTTTSTATPAPSATTAPAPTETTSTTAPAPTSTATPAPTETTSTATPSPTETTVAPAPSPSVTPVTTRHKKHARALRWWARKISTKWGWTLGHALRWTTAHRAHPKYAIRLHMRHLYMRHHHLRPFALRR